MAAAVDRLTRRVRRLEQLAVELQGLATDLAEELSIVRRMVRADVSGGLEAAIECGLLRARESRRRATMRAASAGARTLETRPLRNGASMVRIDEGKWFRLSKGDARLLRALTHGSPVEVDGFPGWLTYQQLAEELGRKTGVRPTRRALVESVYRIRRALKSADLNEYLLKVDRKAGRLRFLLQLQPACGVPART